MVGDNIKAARIAAGLTQKELAAKIGLRHYQILQRWEYGQFKPSMNYLLKLADTLNMPIEELARD